MVVEGVADRRSELEPSSRTVFVFLRCGAPRHQFQSLPCELLSCCAVTTLVCYANHRIDKVPAQVRQGSGEGWRSGCPRASAQSERIPDKNWHR